jgi:hypothetical protein
LTCLNASVAAQRLVDQANAKSWENETMLNVTWTRNRLGQLTATWTDALKAKGNADGQGLKIARSLIRDVNAGSGKRLSR